MFSKLKSWFVKITFRFFNRFQNFEVLLDVISQKTSLKFIFIPGCLVSFSILLLYHPPKLFVLWIFLEHFITSSLKKTHGIDYNNDYNNQENSQRRHCDVVKHLLVKWISILAMRQNIELVHVLGPLPET